MSDYSKTFKAACVQAEPVWLGLKGSVDKTIALAGEAAAQGAEVVAFPECWIPGYPWWIWLDSVAWQSQFVVRYAQNSLELDSPEFERIRQAAASLGIAIVLGFSERIGGTLYIAQAFISSSGEVLRTRRKLKPTHVERSVFGDGDGSDLIVFDSEFGRLGGLCCAEHLQPLTKFAMFSQQEQLHVAAWPSFSIYPGAAYALGPEVNTAASQQYAVEARYSCWRQQEWSVRPPTTCSLIPSRKKNCCTWVGAMRESTALTAVPLPNRYPDRRRNNLRGHRLQRHPRGQERIRPRLDTTHDQTSCVCCSTPHRPHASYAPSASMQPRWSSPSRWTPSDTVVPRFPLGGQSRCVRLRSMRIVLR